MLLQVVIFFYLFLLFDIVYKFSVVCSFPSLTAFLFLDLP